MVFTMGVDIGFITSKCVIIKDGEEVQAYKLINAGTGRFLEVMAQALGYTVTDLGALSAKSTEKVAISSTCTVFAESEVISHLAGLYELAHLTLRKRYASTLFRYKLYDIKINLYLIFR